MPLMRFLCLLLVAACAAWFAVATHAEEAAPLFPPPASTASQQTAQPPGLVQRIGAAAVRAERDFSRELNRHMAAIRRGEGAGALLGGILAAFLYGVFHTLAVGHGKTVVVGYFLGHAARPVHGLAMAAWIAVSHVLGAIVVAFGAHWLLRQMTLSPIEQNHWVRIVSFGAIALIGAWMLWGEMRRLRSGAGHSCGHDHGHDHHHHAGHATPAGRQRALAIAAGFVPCSGAILILTFAFANGILLSGLLMVGGIALGMALTLSCLGLASMALHRQVIARAGRGLATRTLALLGPALILLIGTLLCAAEIAVAASSATN